MISIAVLSIQVFNIIKIEKISIRQFIEKMNRNYIKMKIDVTVS